MPGSINVACAAEETVNYTYDQLDRLVGVEYVNRGAIQYSYDKAGDVTNLTISRSSILNLTDAISFLQMLAGKAPSGVVTTASDINGDDKIGMEEVLYLLQQVAK